MLWNIGKGPRAKCNDSDFQSVLREADEACISECWITDSDVDDIVLRGYETLKFPRKHGKGGGMVIFIKNKIYEFIKVVDNIADTVIVVKIYNYTLESKPIYLIHLYFVISRRKAAYFIEEMTQTFLSVCMTLSVNIHLKVKYLFQVTLKRDVGCKMILFLMIICIRILLIILCL